MATADEVLASMTDAQAAEGGTYDFVIDNDLRVVSVPALGVVLGVEGDKLTNRVTFRMPRYYKSQDLSGFTVRVNYSNASGEVSYAEAADVVSGADEITFAWDVDEPAVRYQGDVSFVVRLTKLSGTTVAQAFDTTVGTAKCLTGLLVESQITPEDMTDLKARLLADCSEGIALAQGAAETARSAASAANGAASQAQSAASQALNIAASIALGASAESEISELRAQNEQLAGMLADATGKFIYQDGRVFCPSSKASVSGTTLTFGSTCSVSGTTIKLD